MTDDIRDALLRAADLLPERPTRIEDIRRRRAARRRRRTVAIVAGVAVVSMGLVLAVAALSRPRPQPVVSVDPPPELKATGVVMAFPGHRPRFCAPVVVAAVLQIPAPKPTPCLAGIDVEGVDLHRLTDRHVIQGVVEGTATLSGSLRGDVLVVSSQAPPVKDPSPYTTPDISPPCPVPAEGWKDWNHRPITGVTYPYYLRHGDRVAAVGIYRPGPDKAIPYIVVWKDADTVRADLSRRYGDQLCVLQSPWSQTQFTDAAHAVPFGAGAELGIYFWGGQPYLNAAGQPSIPIAAVRPLPSLQAQLDQRPKGIYTVTYWLHPLAG